MNLRTRLLLGYWYLVALLMLSAAAAALGFHQLGTNIGHVLDENFESVHASLMMLSALERQDSAVLASLLEESGAFQQLEQSEAAFFAAMDRANNNVTIAAERPILSAIAARYSLYREARDIVLATTHDRPLRDYEATVYPHFEAVRNTVLELLDLNHDAMIGADRRAQDSAQSMALIHALLVAIAILSLAFLSRGLGRDLLARLGELRSVAQALAEGDLRRRASVVRDDELGVVARQLNAALDHEVEIEGALSGRLLEQRQLLLGIIEELPHKSAILSLSGAVIASTLTEVMTDRVALAAAHLTQASRDSVMTTHSVNFADWSVIFSPLASAAKRPVGWLARPEDIVNGERKPS